MTRLISSAVLTLLSSLALTMPVLAAAPSNDTHAGRIAIAGLPFRDSVDTSDATTDRTDARANADCGAPATDASVWYRVTAPSDKGLVIDVSRSDYSAGVIVVTGRPRNFSLVACGPGTVAFETVEGAGYKFLAFDDQFDGGGNGGTLEIVVDEIPPPPKVDVTLDRFGRFHRRTGSAIISGTITCEGWVDHTSIEVSARQRAGHVLITGYGAVEGIECDGTSRRWSAEVSSDNGLFKGGKAMTVSVAYACGPFDCGDGYDERIVHLRGKRS